jgi:hypothetical protein
VRGTHDPAQLLDVEMEKIACRRVFVALDRRPWFQVAHPAQLQPFQNAAHRGPAQPCLLGDPEARPALPPQCLYTADQLS